MAHKGGFTLFLDRVIADYKRGSILVKYGKNWISFEMEEVRDILLKEYENKHKGEK